MESRELNTAAVGRILDGLGLAPGRPEFVAKASTCEVWRAATRAGPVAIRVLAPRPGKPGEIDADVALRRRLLAAADLAVARPVADHRERPDLAAGTAWAVDQWINGDPADAGTDATVWRALGELLAVLHALPVAGHGRLAVTGHGLVGRRSAAAAGIPDRLDAPWPFGGGPLASHPVVAAAPGLAARLAPLEPAIRDAAAARAVITHGDLNGANVRHAGGRLRGLIDFADATVLAPAWDFASLRYFQGPEAVLLALEGYTADRRRAAGLAAASELLALVVALHHVSRAGTLDLPARRATALTRLRRGLDALVAG